MLDFRITMLRLKRRPLLLTTIVIVLVVVLSIYVIGVYSGVKAAIEITTSDTAKVYVDGVIQGTTPVTVTNTNVGVHILKLVPENSQLLPYETPLSLAPQVKTIVRHKFSSKSYLSSTEIISFQKQVKSEATITVVTKPADSEILFDGNLAKSSPAKFVSPSGPHFVVIKRADFDVKSIDVESLPGYDLTVYVELAATSLPQELSQKESLPATFVVVKNAPNRKATVYESPNIYSQEVGHIASGKVIEVLDRDEKNLWIKVFSQDTPAGWIQQKYSSPSAQPATPP